MKKLSLFLRVATLLALCLSAYAYYTTEGIIAKKSAEIVRLSQELTDAKGKISNLEKNLVQLRGKVADLSTDLQAEKDNYARLYREYNDNKATLNQTELDLKTTEEELAAQKVIVRQLQGEISSLKGKISRKDTEIGTLKRNLVNAQNEARKYQGQIAALTNEMTKREEARRSTGYLVRGPLAPLVGTTTKVLASEANGSVILVGWNSKTKLYPEMIFSISRPQGKPVRVKVIEVHKNYSVLHVSPSEGVAPFKKGESVEIVPIIIRS